MKRLINWLNSLFNTYSVLTHDEIQELIKSGAIRADPERVNATSVDVTLHNECKVEDIRNPATPVHLVSKQTPKFITLNLLVTDEELHLSPGSFMLGATNEIFNLPDDITAVFYMKSSLARCGLDHCNAGFIDPGFNTSRLTLELTNILSNHTLVLSSGMPIGQIKFYRHRKVPADKSYRAKGQYNGDMFVQESKGVR